MPPLNPLIQSLVTRLDLNTSNTEPASNTVVDYVSSKWQALLYYAQVKISESRAPLTGDIVLIAEVIQRKHDFEKMQRTMMANLGSARLLPGLQPDSKRLEDLHTYQTIIAGWASQLERVASSLQGLLAVSESLKASQQATRTQNLTILAFVFIPVSTVSSIYGMITVEIAQQNPHIWQFGVSAAVTTLAAIFAAWSYHYWMAIPRFLLSSVRISSTKEKATPAQRISLGPVQPSPRPADQTTAANLHTQPAKVSTTAISPNHHPKSTRATNQTHPLTNLSQSIPRRDTSEIENGRPPDDDTVHPFPLSNPQFADTAKCIVM